MIGDAAGPPRREQGSWRVVLHGRLARQRDRVEDEPCGALAWLPDGAEVDTTMRHLLAEQPGDTEPIDPEADLAGFYPG